MTSHLDRRGGGRREVEASRHPDRHREKRDDPRLAFGFLVQTIATVAAAITRLSRIALPASWASFLQETREDATSGSLSQASSEIRMSELLRETVEDHRRKAAPAGKKAAAPRRRVKQGRRVSLLGCKFNTPAFSTPRLEAPGISR